MLDLKEGGYVPGWKYVNSFAKSIGIEEASRKREFKTFDIVKRLGVISGDRVFLNNFPIRNPIAVFNPAIVVNGDNVYLYIRVILGYYMYVSGIAESVIPLEDILSGTLNINYYAANLVVHPTLRYDMWGTEDPRVYEIDGHILMTYCGRTINYFNPAVRVERTLPITAVREREKHEYKYVWRKVAAFVMPREWRSHVVSDRDSFLVKVGEKLSLFHRPHMDDGGKYAFVSRIDKSVEELISVEKIMEIEVKDPVQVLWPAPFESHIGWAMHPIKLSSNEFIAFAHGVDREIEAYRLFAIQLEFASDGIIVKAVTPRYIMEPKMPYEVFGDRPYTVFPCGIWEYEKGRYLITYGAADFFVGIGEIVLDDLMAELDRGRIF